MAKALVVYYSGTGNTELMAEKVAEGLKNGGASVDVKHVSEASSDEVKDYDLVAFGCPSMGEEVLEEEQFEPFFADCEGFLNGKKIGLFGSYGWGDGEWMRNWVARANDCGAKVLEEGVIAHETPDDDAQDACVKYGEKLAKF